MRVDEIFIDRNLKSRSIGDGLKIKLVQNQCQMFGSFVAQFNIPVIWGGKLDGSVGIKLS